MMSPVQYQGKLAYQADDLRDIATYLQLEGLIDEQYRWRGLYNTLKSAIPAIDWRTQVLTIPQYQYEEVTSPAPHLPNSTEIVRVEPYLQKRAQKGLIVSTDGLYGSLRSPKSVWHIPLHQWEQYQDYGKYPKDSGNRPNATVNAFHNTYGLNRATKFTIAESDARMFNKVTVEWKDSLAEMRNVEEILPNKPHIIRELNI